MSDQDDERPVGQIEVYESANGNISVRSHTMLPKRHPYYQLIGRVASGWTLFEHVLDRIIWDLSQIPQDIALCITGHLMGATPRFKMIQSLGEHEGVSDELLKKARRLKQDQYEIGEQRNRVVHDPWFYILDDTPNAQTTQLKTSGYVPITEDELNSTIEEIRQFIIRAEELQADFMGELRTLRQTRT